MSHEHMSKAFSRMLIQLPIIFIVLGAGVATYNYMGDQATPVGVASRAILLLSTALITALLSADLISWFVEGTSLRVSLFSKRETTKEVEKEMSQP